MTIQKLVEQKLCCSDASVFLRRDFNDIGNYDQVGRILRAAVKQGLLVKVGYGVYVKARVSVSTGNPIPVIPLLAIGLQVFSKLGKTVEVGRLWRAYMEGNSTQIPMASVINIGKKRISRKLAFGSNTIQYER
jgi:hypothetical protein